MKGCISLLYFLLSALGVVQSQSIVNTVHNLSVSGPGSIKATNEDEICLFCHTPHNSRPISPLWNRKDPGGPYTLYNSSTKQAVTGQPDGSSILCLSCHDGTIALGNIISRKNDIDFTASITTMPSGNSNLTTDLSNDHPVSFIYNTSLAAVDGQLANPENITHGVKLESSKLQCTSCHDPHKNIYSDFLVETTQYSTLCVTCHQKTNWTNSSHKTSVKTWNGSDPNPWSHTTWTNVAQNACENCHNPHNANGKPRLLKYTQEEYNCFDCHNGNVAEKNIQSQFSKPYGHKIENYTGIHDAAEGALVTSKHVECEDCHSPHETNNTTASAPNVKGINAGVKGVDQRGIAVNPVQYLYQICYRCHSDNPATAPSTSREIVQNNTRLEFEITNPSFHPVAGPRNNTSVQTLINGWTESGIMYCTDCHSGDGNNASAGPHGSNYPQILKYQYSKTDYTTESANSYAICYSCHDRNQFILDGGDNVQSEIHYKHVVIEKTPCNACHDPHGISSVQGNSTNNSNLINFDKNIVKPLNGNVQYVDNGYRTGNCSLTCHNKAHNSTVY